MVNVCLDFLKLRQRNAMVCRFDRAFSCYADTMFDSVHQPNVTFILSKYLSIRVQQFSQAIFFSRRNITSIYISHPSRITGYRRYIMTLLAAYPPCITRYLPVFQVNPQPVILETCCVLWMPVDYTDNHTLSRVGLRMVTPKHPLMDPTTAAWSSKPPFRGSSNGSSIPFLWQRGPDTVTLHDDNAGIFILMCPAIFTALPSISC